MLVDCRHIAFPFPFVLVSCRSILSGIHGWLITHRSEGMIRKALHLQVKIPLFRNLRQRRISFSFFQNLCIHYLIFRYSVIAVPIYKMVLFEHRHQCFLCLGIGLSTPVQTQDREQIRGRIPFRLYLSAFSRTEIEKRFSSTGSFWRKLSLRLFKKVTSSFSYQYR